MRPSPSLLIAALLLGCVEDEPADEARFVAPLDGQSAVDLDAPLQVHGVLGELPPDHPVPQDFLRVVELADGGFVPGEVVIDGDDVLFWPDGGWAPDRRYAWVVDPVAVQARMPEVHVPEALLGESLFATASEVALLDAVIDGGTLCLLLSEGDGDLPARQVLSIDGEEVPLRLDLVPISAAERGLELAEGIGTVSALCGVPGDAPVQPGASVRLTLGESASWQVEAREAPLDEVWLERHRWSPR